MDPVLLTFSVQNCAIPSLSDVLSVLNIIKFSTQFYFPPFLKSTLIMDCVLEGKLYRFVVLFNNFTTLCTASPYTRYITNISIKSIKVSVGKLFMYEYELKPSSVLKFKLKKT